MKKTWFIILLALGLTAIASAQTAKNREQARERIEAYKVAFFTEKLQLTTEESKAFWPLYNEFEQAREELRNKYERGNKRLELLSDEELEKHLDDQLKMEEEMVQLRRKFYQRFKQVLPIRKVAMLQKVENEFKRELLKELRRRQKDRFDNDQPKPGRRN